ncbi:MAG: cysteine desulfurase family protein [Calditrichaceae bacterium]
MKQIYLDNAATTPVDVRVLEYMMPYLTEKWGNSTGTHYYSRIMNDALEESRTIFAKILGGKESEIVFTGSATESNNTIIKGIARADNPKGKHIIISAIEHSSVHETCRYLEKSGYEITVIPVNRTGRVNPDDIQSAIRPDTLLVSVILVNNEIGTLEPVEKIGRICHAAGVLFHTDAVQGFGKIDLNVNKFHIDLLSASSHKIYGPGGAGLLYIRSGVKMDPLLHGGMQENGLRSSTVNVAAIAGFAKAAELMVAERMEENNLLGKFKNKIIGNAQKNIPEVLINGDPEYSVNHIVSISFKNADGELIAMQLDREGIAVSTGSSCSSGQFNRSHVLSACRIPESWAKGTIRISLGRFTKETEIDYLMEILPEIVKKVRKIS